MQVQLLHDERESALHGLVQNQNIQSVKTCLYPLVWVKAMLVVVAAESLNE